MIYENRLSDNDIYKSKIDTYRPLRADYIRAIQDTNHNKFTTFINFVSEMVLESQKEYLRIIERLR